MSELTEDMIIGEMLRLTGQLNITVGMRSTDDKIFEDKGSWNGKVLSNLGAGFCKVQGEKPKKATVINDEWMLQGHRGTNPFKAKIKSIKAEKMASSSIKECAATRAKGEVKSDKFRNEKPAWLVDRGELSEGQGWAHCE